MSGNVKQRALEARQLFENPIFIGLLDDVLADATELFLNPSCDNVRLSEAHERVRAVNIVKATLQSRLSDEAVHDKQQEKAQHRGSD